VKGMLCIARPRDSLPSERSSISKLASATVVAQVVSVLASPVITRIYSAEAYGGLALYFVLVNIISSVCTGNYHTAVVIPEKDEDAASVAVLSLLLVCFSTVIGGLSIALFGAHIAQHRQLGHLGLLLWMIPASVLVRGTMSTFELWCIRQKTFGKLAQSRLLDSASGSLAVVLSGLLVSAGTGSLVIGRCLGSVISVLFLVLQAVEHGWFSFCRHVNLKSIVSQASRFRAFPLVSSWGILLEATSYAAQVALIGYYWGADTVGHLALVERIIATPLSLVGNAVADVSLKKAADELNQGDHLGPSMKKVFGRLIEASLFPAILLGVFGRSAFSIIFGARWELAGLYAQIMTLYGVGQFLSSTMKSYCLTTGRQHTFSLSRGAIAVCRLSSICVGGALHSPVVAVTLLSVSVFLVHMATLAWLVTQATGAMWDTVTLFCVPFRRCLPPLLFTLVVNAVLGTPWGLVAASATMLFVLRAYLLNDVRR
jgi:O-antigen/teichoic acid export membrane protein